MSESLKIPQSVFNSMIKHAESIQPIESCGYLAGNGMDVVEFIPMTNVDNARDHFSFDPKEQFAVVKDMRQKKLSLIAVYHSHPETPARLSEEDLTLFNDPNPVYIIVSLCDSSPIAKGFFVKKPTEHEVQVEEVKLEVI